MCKLLSENPAKLYGVYPQKGVLAPGSDADIVVLDPEKESVISAATHAYNTDNNPFEGIRLRCGIDKVFLRGSLTVDDGRLVKEKLGKYIARGKNKCKYFCWREYMKRLIDKLHQEQMLTAEEFHDFWRIVQRRQISMHGSWQIRSDRKCTEIRFMYVV